jgi:hypothetical protein
MSKMSEIGARHLLTQLELVGYASVKVSDGSIFAFSKARIEEFLASMNESGQEKIVIFVKEGETIDEESLAKSDN